MIGFFVKIRTMIRIDKKKGRFQLFTLLNPVILLIALVLFPGGPHGLCQDPLDQIKFEYINVNHGLSSGAVYSIRQDKKGFMWIGTDEGLNKYDGKTFTHYKYIPGKNEGMNAFMVYSVYVDDSGIIWAATRDGGLNRLDPVTGQFTHFMHDPSNPDSITSNIITEVTGDREGRLWLRFQNQGLDCFDPKTGIFKHYKHAPANPDSLSGNGVIKVTVDSKGRVWAATLYSGICLYEKEIDGFKRFMPDPENPGIPRNNVVDAMGQEHSGKLWVAVAYKGLCLLEPDTGKFSPPVFKLKKEDSTHALIIERIFQDKTGLVWLGTIYHKVIVYNPQNNTYRSFQKSGDKPGGFRGLRTYDIFEDRGGVIWIGNRTQGINKYAPFREKFSGSTYRYGWNNTLHAPNVFALYKDKKGILWVGAYGGGLSKIDRADNRVTTFKRLDDNPKKIGGNCINAITEMPDGVLWIGTVYNGICRMDIQSETFTQYRCDPRNPSHSLTRGQILYFLAIPPNHLWIGANFGLSRMDISTGKFDTFRHDPAKPGSISNSVVCSIHKDRDNTLWFGTYGGGVNRFNPGTNTFTPFRISSPSSQKLHNLVFSLNDAEPGFLWLGTQVGLVKFNTRFKPGSDGKLDETFTRYTTADGLPDNAIYAVLRDESGHLWLSTNRGISRFDPVNRQFKNYGLSAGLQGYKYHVCSYYKARDGEMFFGGHSGFDSFYPGQIKSNPNEPPVVFTSFNLFNKPVPIAPGSVLEKHISDTRELVLSYDQNICSFRVAALDFTAPEANRYRYKVPELSSHWVDLGTENRISFTGLEPGTYTLQVNGTNNDGLWSGTETTLKIIVTPPYWQTFWFRALILIAAAVLVFLWHRSRMKHLRLQLRTEKEMEQICEKYNVSPREREVLDLVMKGKANKEIEEELFISLRTVKAHVHNLYKKFGVSSRLELINQIQKKSNNRNMESSHVS